MRFIFTLQESLFDSYPCIVLFLETIYRTLSKVLPAKQDKTLTVEVQLVFVGKGYTVAFYGFVVVEVFAATLYLRETRYIPAYTQHTVA